MGGPGHRESLSVVVPTFEEEGNIERCLLELRAWLTARFREWELIVVDNASSDDTVRLAQRELADGAGRVMVNRRNSGKGHSVRRGMLAARGDLRLYCDADCWHSLESLDGMVELAADHAVVAGSRLAGGAHVARPQTFARRLVGPTFLGLTRALMHESAEDVYCGFKLWRGEAADAVFERATLDGWAFDAEVLGIARALGFGVVESGIVWHNRDDSRLAISRTIVPALRDLLRARANVRATVAEQAFRAQADRPSVADSTP